MRLSITLIALLVSCTRPAEAPRIAVVDIQRIVRSCNAGQRATRELAASKEKLQAALNAKQADLKARMDALASSPAKDPTEAAQLAAALQVLRTDVEQQNAELEAQQRALVDGLLPRVSAAVSAVATQEKFQVVLDRETVPFVGAETIDVTDRCIEALNRDLERQDAR
jgi:Skp family chaperone for outer membrane proteins